MRLNEQAPARYVRTTNLRPAIAAPMTPPDEMVRVDLPRLAFERITHARAHAGAKRIGFVGGVHWDASPHVDLHGGLAASIRVTCSVAVATVLVYCFHELAAESNAKRDYAGLVAIDQAVTQVLDRVDFALGSAVSTAAADSRAGAQSRMSRRHV